LRQHLVRRTVIVATAAVLTPTAPGCGDRRPTSMPRGCGFPSCMTSPTAPGSSF
jgi:hypothetical protein